MSFNLSLFDDQGSLHPSNLRVQNEHEVTGDKVHDK